MSSMEANFKRSMEGLAELEQSIERMKMKRYAKGYTDGVVAGVDLVLRSLVEVGLIDAEAAEQARLGMATEIAGVEELLDSAVEEALS